MALKEILAAQDCWAKKRWPGHSGRRAPSLETNLIFPMSREVRDQISNGNGSELGTTERPGKMSSLRSSSALTYNFFAPWIGHDLSPLAVALTQPVNDGTLQFERKFPHGLASIPPNLDVTLDNGQARPLALECKYSEPYGPKKIHPPLSQKYFAGGRKRWAEEGLPQCEELAASLGQSVEFRRLDVGQLLKHILGLAWTTKLAPRLVYLWFDTKCEEASEHIAELYRFTAYLDPQIEFKALSYQDVFAILQRGPEPVPGYFEYLALRYFDA